MIYKKTVEGVVSAAVPLLKPLYKRDKLDDCDRGYEGGVLDTVTHLLLTKGADEKALYAKVKQAFAEMKNSSWLHTQVAESRIVAALLA